MATDGPPTSSGAADDSLLVAVFHESPVATVRTTVADGLVGLILEANGAAEQVLGRSDLVGARLADLAVAGSILEVADRPTQHLLSMAVHAPHLDEVTAPRWIEATVAPLSAAASPGQAAALVLLQDVTERRAHDHHRDLAQRQDPLTGLANRRGLVVRLAELSVSTDGPFVAALFLDLDRFKRVNHYRGHAGGDEVLVAVASRIRSAVRPGDTVARVGGDEFVVLCPAVTDPLDAEAIAERVRDAISQKLDVRGRSMRITASVGVATAAVGTVEPGALLHAADEAMYAAKAGGRNRTRSAEGRPLWLAEQEG